MWCFITIFVVAQCCALKHSRRIYGGNDAKPDEYPYVVGIEIQRYFRLKNNSIAYEHDHLCTGSALTSKWVLSAAHCFEVSHEYHLEARHSVEKLIVKHGHIDHLPGNLDSYSDVLFTIKYPKYCTPLYKIKNYGHIKHDIGLLKTHPMNIKSYVKLSAVDYKCFYGYEVLFAGFGITAEMVSKGENGTMDIFTTKKHLQVLKVLITKCVPNENGFLSLCLASRCGHASVLCRGDSGGPLLHSSGVLGVLSLRSDSGFCLDTETEQTDYVAGYVTPVSPYIEWIYNIIKY